MRKFTRSHSKHLHHLVAEVIDDLDRDAAARRPRERARRVGIEAGAFLRLEGPHIKYRIGEVSARALEHPSVRQ